MTRTRVMLLVVCAVVGEVACSSVDAQLGGEGASETSSDAGASVDDAESSFDARPIADGGDAAPADDASIGSLPTSCPGSYVLCEDFESGSLDGGTWKVTNPTNVSVDAARSRSGTHSLHFTDAAQVRTSLPFPQLANDMWGRVFVYMVQTPPGSTTTNAGPNSSIAWAAGGNGVTRFGFRHTRFSSGYNYPGDDFTNTDDLVWPLNQWVCLEWHYVSDPVSGMGTQDYWMNGVARPKTHFDAHPMPSFTYFWLGEYLFGSAYDVWMDDLVLDTAQVGCSG